MENILWVIIGMFFLAHTDAGAHLTNLSLIKVQCMHEVYPLADADKSSYRFAHIWAHAACMHKYMLITQQR